MCACTRCLVPLPFIVAVGLGFDSRAVIWAQCCQQLAADETVVRSCVAQALSREDGPATCYTLRRNTASIIKIRFFENVIDSFFVFTVTKEVNNML